MILKLVLSQCFTDGEFRTFNRTEGSFGRNGEYTFTARVDVCYNGTFGSICDIGWDEEDARVFCGNELAQSTGSGYCKLLGSIINIEDFNAYK